MNETDKAAFLATAQNLGLHPYEFGGLINLESGFNPNVWGGDKGRYQGLIQFGPGARKETGLPARDNWTIAEQLPYVERYFQGRGYKPGMGITKAYATVLVGNPGGNLNAKDSFGTSAGPAAQEMMEGGRHYKAAQNFLGPLDPNNVYAGASVKPNPAKQTVIYLTEKDKENKPLFSMEKAKQAVEASLLQQALTPVKTEADLLAAMFEADLQQQLGISRL